MHSSGPCKQQSVPSHGPSGKLDVMLASVTGSLATIWTRLIRSVFNCHTVKVTRAKSGREGSEIEWVTTPAPNTRP